MTTSIPCFKGCGRPRIAGHVVCEACHSSGSCEKCIRTDELASRMKKRRATIEARKDGRISA